MADGTGWRGGDDGIESALLAFIAREVASTPDGLTTEEHLVETGRVDSLGLLQIVSFVNTSWRVDLMSLGDPGDLRSIATLAAAVRRERTARHAVPEGA
jgi:acyl carrier protein